MSFSFIKNKNTVALLHWLKGIDGSLEGVYDENGMTALHEAVRVNWLGGVIQMVESGRIPVDIEDEMGGGLTPLIVSVQERGIEILKYLIENDANIDRREEYKGMAPLHFSAAAGDWAVLEVLLSAGADVSQLDEAGEATALIWAAKAKCQRCVQMLLEAGADPESKDFLGRGYEWYLSDKY